MKNIQFDGETMAQQCKKRAMAWEKNGKIAGNLTIIKLSTKKTQSIRGRRRRRRYVECVCDQVQEKIEI